LFQPFVTFGKENGIGLGLTVVQSIVQQHHGHVSVERSDSGGTTFRIALPADATAGRASLALTSA
jgi:nitrogen-specific signal transduction histidine kinase